MRRSEEDDIRQLLEQSRYFVRKGDYTAAVARARQALMESGAGVLEEQSALELQRCLTAERAWMEDVKERFLLHRRHEVELA